MNNENFSNDANIQETGQKSVSNHTNTPTTNIVRSKSDFVRQVLREIGALSEDNPPIGWVHEVEKRLSENKLSMHRNMIYLTRRKMLDAGKQNKKSGVSKNKVVKRQSYTQNHRTASNNSTGENSNKAIFTQNQLNALQEVQKFAEAYGGLQQLNEAIKFLLTVKNN